MYDTYYDKFQPCFVVTIKHSHYLDTDSLVVNINLNDIVKALQNVNDLFEFSN